MQSIEAIEHQDSQGPRKHEIKDEYHSIPILKGEKIETVSPYGEMNQKFYNPYTWIRHLCFMIIDTYAQQQQQQQKQRQCFTM